MTDKTQNQTIPISEDGMMFRIMQAGVGVVLLCTLVTLQFIQDPAIQAEILKNRIAKAPAGAAALVN